MQAFLRSRTRVGLAIMGGVGAIGLLVLAAKLSGAIANFATAI